MRKAEPIPSLIESFKDGSIYWPDPLTIRRNKRKARKEQERIERKNRQKK